MLLITACLVLRCVYVCVCVQSVVESAYHETSKYLLQVLHSKYNLMENMKVRVGVVFRWVWFQGYM